MEIAAIVLDVVDRHYLVDAPNYAAIEKFVASQKGCVRAIPRCLVQEGETDLMLDDDGKVIYDRYSQIVPHSYEYWPSEVVVATLYRDGCRDTAYVITPERDGDYAVNLQVVNNFGNPAHSASLLSASLKLMKASLDGFAIGYSGAGSHQLAHAILLYEFWNPILAAEYAEAFRNQIISSLTGPNVISGEWVRRWVKDKLPK